MLEGLRDADPPSQAARPPGETSSPPGGQQEPVQQPTAPRQGKGGPGRVLLWAVVIALAAAGGWLAALQFGAG